MIAVSDSRGATYDRTGLDVPALAAHKREHPVQDFAGGRPVPRDAVLGLECDVLVPAAQPDVFDAGNADAVRAKVIPQGANIPATAEAEQRIQERGILGVPDVVANAGGVICASVEYRGGDRTAAFPAIERKLRDNTGELLERIRDGRPPPWARTGAALNVTASLGRERLEERGERAEQPEEQQHPGRDEYAVGQPRPRTKHRVQHGPRARPRDHREDGLA